MSFRLRKMIICLNQFNYNQLNKNYFIFLLIIINILLSTSTKQTSKCILPLCLHSCFLFLCRIIIYHIQLLIKKALSTAMYKHYINFKLLLLLLLPDYGWVINPLPLSICLLIIWLFYLFIYLLVINPPVSIIGRTKMKIKEKCQCVKCR